MDNEPQSPENYLPSSESLKTSGELESPAEKTQRISPRLLRHVETISKRFAAMYGHKWASSFDDADGLASDTWAKGLIGTTPKQLAHGLEACITRNDEWPPTLPEFRAMCLNVPSLAAVKAEFLNPQADRSRFGLLVWRTIDAHAFRHADQFSANRLLTEAYEVAREQIMRGEPLPEHPKVLAHDPQVVRVADVQTVAKYAAELKGIPDLEQLRELYSNDLAGARLLTPLESER
jgi:hypothetical protein